MDDPFIRNYIEDLLKNIRTQVLLKLIKPYTRIRIPFISKVTEIHLLPSFVYCDMGLLSFFCDGTYGHVLFLLWKFWHLCTRYAK